MFFFFQAEDGIRDIGVTGVQTCALPISVKMLERIDQGEGTPMDLDILEQVQGNIMGNCLCVLGDSMAMPVSSMLKHFREEFEHHMEEARERRDLEDLPSLGAPELASVPEAGPV